MSGVAELAENRAPPTYAPIELTEFPANSRDAAGERITEMWRIGTGFLSHVVPEPSQLQACLSFSGGEEEDEGGD